MQLSVGMAVLYLTGFEKKSGCVEYKSLTHGLFYSSAGLIILFRLQPFSEMLV